MVKIFVDTSALFALVNTSETNHQVAEVTWQTMIADGDELVTSNYIIVESIALIQNRLGLPALQKLQANLEPLLNVFWLDQDIHDAAVQLLLSTNRRQLSLVDCSSFETMRCLEVNTVFTFDAHFREQGFNVIP